MRRVLVVEKADSQAEDLAQRLGCTEIASGVPRFEGLVKSLPSVVTESATNSGVVLGVFNADLVSREELDALPDLPEIPEAVDPVETRLTGIDAEINGLKTKLDEVNIEIDSLKAKSAETDTNIADLRARIEMLEAPEVTG